METNITHRIPIGTFFLKKDGTIGKVKFLYGLEKV